MAKEVKNAKRSAKGDQKVAKRRGAAKAGLNNEVEPSKVVKLTKEGASKPVAAVRNAYEVSVQFLREVRTELKKVTWPSRKETLASTGVVLVVVFIVAIYLGLVDLALSRFIAAILH